MILVLAGRYDSHARRLVEALRGRDARLLTSRDITSPGWQLHVGAPGEDLAVIGGERVPAKAISAVITRQACVALDDLAHVVEEDRAYVSAEATAFLAAFLSRLACPVLNRPSALSLMGPSWGREHWTALAARAGIRAAWTERRYPPPPDEDPTALFKLPAGAVEVTVIGDRCLGDVDPALRERSIRLASIGRTRTLAVQWSGPEASATFLGAHGWPDLSRPEAVTALLDLIDAPLDRGEVRP